MDVRDLAHQLHADLAPGCDRLEIAGSIRRCKPDPRDIELVAIPRRTTAPVLDLFGAVVASRGENLLDDALSALWLRGEWQYDLALRRNGPKYKRLRHVATDICCDLFITTPECWGVIFTIRTGPGDFSQELVTRARRMGMVVDEGRLWKVHRDESRTAVETGKEEQFFAALGLRWVAPPARSVAVLANR